MSTSPLNMPPPQPVPVGQPGSASSPPPGAPSASSTNGDQSLQLVTQHLMEAEQALQAAAKIKPELATIVDKFVNEVKPQAGQILFGQGGQSPSQSPSQSSPQPSLQGLVAGAGQGMGQ